MVITYNHEKYIAQALESVLMQKTDFHFEINVIEDCSTDRTQEIVMGYVRQYPHIVKPFFNKKNIGFKVTQKNFYRGFFTLTGKYLAILEGDDYWSTPDKLQKQVDFLDANPDFAMCAGNTVKVYEDGSQEPHRFLYWGKRADGTVHDVINLRIFFHTTGLLYRNVFNGSPPRQFANKWSCDIFVMIAHSTHGKVHHIDEDMAVYRAHPGGRFSGMKVLDGWFFNIDSLRRYNAWLGYRYYVSFAESITRYCEHVLNSHGKEGAARLTPFQMIKVRTICAFYGSIFWAASLPKRLKRWRQRVLRLIKQGLLRPTRLEQLPALPASKHWDLIWGLNVKRMTDIGAPRFPSPVMLLTAAPARDPEAQQRHALSQRIDDLAPGLYRVTVWAKSLNAVNLQLHVRDSVNPGTGKIANEGEVRCDLSTSSIVTSSGFLSAEVETGPDGWLKVSTDIKTDDGRLFVYIGMLRASDNSHTFEGNGEQMLFGGIVVAPRPAGATEKSGLMCGSE